MLSKLGWVFPLLEGRRFFLFKCHLFISSAKGEAQHHYFWGHLSVVTLVFLNTTNLTTKSWWFFSACSREIYSSRAIVRAAAEALASRQTCTI